MSDPPVIRYLNTDLDLVSDVPLEPLAAELTAFGVVGRIDVGEDGRWYAMFETFNDAEPEINILQLLDALDRLSPHSAGVLRGCSSIEFNIGYDCGDEPWGFNQGLSNETLKRMADLGAKFRITLYPYRPDGDYITVVVEPDAAQGGADVTLSE